MIAVSNTTPLRYLIAIKQEHLLAQLFEQVVIPTAVYEELTDPRAPEAVRQSILSPPKWLEVRPAPAYDAALFALPLHRGERESIVLAEAIRCDVVLIDEQAGRSIALARNLPVSGTLGVMEQADTQGMIRDFAAVLDELIDSGFFIRPSLKRQLLDRHCARRSGK